MNIRRYIRRTIKFLLITIVTLLLTTGLLTYLFQDKIIGYFVQEANKSLKTPVTYDKIGLNFFAEFPKVSIHIQNPMIKGSLPDQTDTLAHIKNLYLSFDLYDIIEGKYQINKLTIEDATISLYKDLNKNVNYDIIKPDTSSKTSANLSFNLKEIALKNVTFRYKDDPSSIAVNFKAKEALASLLIDSLINAKLNGDLFINTIKVKEDEYFNHKNINLDLGLAINLNTNEILFSPSTLQVEGANFGIEGSLGYGKTAEMALEFSAQESKISALISLLPQSISKELSGYDSKGEVYLSGRIKGKTYDTHTPFIEVNFGFKNASFFHPGFHQEISNASLTGYFSNGSKHNASTSQLELKDFTATLNNHPIKGYLSYTNFIDPYLKLNLNGSFEAQSVLHIYPIPSIKNAKGTASINVLIDGKLLSLKDNAGLGKVKTQGTIAINGLEFIHTAKNMPYKDISGTFAFNGNDLKINKLEAKAGASDMNFHGAFKNFVAFIFLENQPLIIQANFSSGRLDLDELLSQSFTSAEETTSDQPSYSFSIPKNVEMNLQCKVDNVKFRRMNGSKEIKNIKGNISLKDQKVTFSNMAFDFAGGQVVFEDCTPQNLHGISSSGESGTTVSSTIHFKDMDIHQTFYLFEDFTQEFITHKNLRGTLNADLVITRMLFDKHLNLDAESIDVDVFDLTISEGELVDFEPLSDLYDYLKDYKFGNIINLNIPKYFNKENLNQNAFSHLKFKRLSNEINIRNKVIDIPKMEIESNVTPFVIKGNQAFNGTMNYSIDVNLKNYKKINRQNENLSEYGEVLEDQSKGIWIYTTISGNTENYEFSVDKERMKKEFSRTVKESLSIPDEEDKPIYIAPDVDDDGGFLEEEEF